MHGVGIAEQVVEVAEDLLVGAGEEDAEHVGLAVPELVQLQTRRAVLLAHEAVDLAVGVAGDVLDRAPPHRLLIQPVDGHDREQLIDGPAVGQRLEQREVAEVPVDERRLEVGHDVVVRVAILPADAGDHVDGREVDLLGEGAFAERQHAGVEELVRAVLVERGVVEDLLHAPARHALARDVLVVGHHFVQQRVVVVGERGKRHLGHGLDVDHLEQEQRVVRGEGAPRLADQVRHRLLVLAAGLAQRVHDVVGVFLQRVVHAGVRRGVGAVVVHAQPAADVHVGDVHAHLAQFHVEPRDLLQPRLDEPDVGDLRAEMEMDEPQDVEAAEAAELLDGLHELRRVEPELRLLAAALRPPAESARGELDAHARRGRHLHLVGHLQQHVDLAQLLDDDEHLVAELLPHQGEAHELLVLVTVAHDHVVGVLGEPEHRLQLRLAPTLETHAVRGAELHDLLHHVPLLVDLDRIDRGVAAVVAELLAGGLEVPGEPVDPRPQDVGEPEQHRQRHPLLFEVVLQFEQVELVFRLVPVGTHDHVALGVYVEVARAPAFDVVELARRLDAPARGRRPVRGRRGRHVRRVCPHGGNLTTSRVAVPWNLRRRYGNSGRTRHPSPSRTYSSRSWSRLGMPCQNSMRSGATR